MSTNLWVFGGQQVANVGLNAVGAPRRRSTARGDRADNEGFRPSPLPPVRRARLPARYSSGTTQRTIGRLRCPRKPTDLWWSPCRGREIGDERRDPRAD